MFDPTDLPSRDTEMAPRHADHCPTCDGHGWDRRTDNDCTDCNGTGRFMTQDDLKQLWAAYDAKRKAER